MRACCLKVFATLVFNCAVLGAACGAPTRPTPSMANQSVALETLGLAQSPLFAQAVGLSPQDLVARGWACRPVPSLPTWTQCSHPNQGFPMIPPPDDRPPSFTFLLWDGGNFFGQTVLLRTDLYKVRSVSRRANRIGSLPLRATTSAFTR